MESKNKETVSRSLEMLCDIFLANDKKPNFKNRDFLNALIVFNSVLVDKIYDNQNYIGMSMEERENMVWNCGNELKNIIEKYTGIDTFQVEHLLTT